MFISVCWIGIAMKKPSHLEIWYVSNCILDFLFSFFGFRIHGNLRLRTVLPVSASGPGHPADFLHAEYRHRRPLPPRACATACARDHFPRVSTGADSRTSRFAATRSRKTGEGSHLHAGAPRTSGRIYQDVGFGDDASRCEPTPGSTTPR